MRPAIENSAIASLCHYSRQSLTENESAMNRTNQEASQVSIDTNTVLRFSRYTVLTEVTGEVKLIFHAANDVSISIGLSKSDSETIASWLSEASSELSRVM